MFSVGVVVMLRLILFFFSFFFFQNRASTFNLTSLQRLGRFGILQLVPALVLRID